MRIHKKSRTTRKLRVAITGLNVLAWAGLATHWQSPAMSLTVEVSGHGLHS